MPVISNQLLLLGTASAAWLVLLSGFTASLLTRIGLARPNFRGDRIPVGYGVLILLWSAPVLAALTLITPAVRLELLAFLAVVGGMGVLGFIDDRCGDRSRTGLKGHFRAFFVEGVATTGFMKAVGGGLLALAVPRFLLNRAWPDAALDGAIIALSANALNLLDLRPGRAGAVFLLSAAIVVGFTWTAAALPPLVLVAIPSIVVYERDARGKAMMGDTGSNLLGGTLGLALTNAIPGITPRFALLAGLVALHVVAERVSISRLIERTPILKKLDRLTGVR